MPYTIDVSATSSAPPAVVFDHLARAEAWTVWGPFPGFVRSVRARDGAPDPNGVGAVRRIGPAREEVVAFEPPTRYSYTMLAGFPIRDYRSDVTLEPHEGGTAIRWQSRFEAKIPGTGPLARLVLTALVGGLARGVARHSGRCEAGCPAHPA
jgi:polyketide cyclase/dehydrase/lipid transport protein